MRINKSAESGISRAAEILGGQSALARELGIKSQAVQQWCSAGFCPVDRARQIHDLTGVPIVDLLALPALKTIRDLSAVL
jgi:DNA-binding transcriptional regulator YdaS (Cro superfamily)